MDNAATADQQQQPLAAAADAPTSAPSELSAALAAGSELLLCSLAAGPQPSTDDAALDAQIAAYRASIARLTRQLGQHALPPKAPPAGTNNNARRSSSPARDQDQAAAAAAAARLGDDASAGSQLRLAGLGQEGVDFMVGDVGELDPSEWQVPPHCIPIHANVTTFDWSRLYSVTSFDVIMMDPPWQLATANPTRGVALGYSQLTDHDIRSLPIPQLQTAGGFLFVWVINSKYQFTLDLFDRWGYTLVDEIVWVKMTVNRRMFKSHGYYLQHAKEVCMVARKNHGTQEQQQEQQEQQAQQQQPDPAGTAAAAAAAADGSGPGRPAGGCGISSSSGAPMPGWQGLAGSGSGGGGVGSDIILSERRGQSQKPEEVYELVESLVPGGRYLEIFARKNNLRNYWVSVGNEVTGTGLPEEDMEAFRQENRIPGAVYGRAAPSTSAAASATAAAAAAAGGGGGGGG